MTFKIEFSHHYLFNEYVINNGFKKMNVKKGKRGFQKGDR